MGATRQQGLASAAAFPWRLDVEAARIEFLQVDEGFIREATFLDQRALRDVRLPSAIVDASSLPVELIAAGVVRRPLAWLFHIGHCGSTLLSQVLDGLPGVLGLREPQCLLALASFWSELDQPLSRVARGAWQQQLETCLTLLGRGFHAEQRIVIKPTSHCSSMAERLIGPEDRAVFLRIELVDYLAALLRDPALRHQAWLNALPRLADWQQWTGDAHALRLHGLTSARAIALSWEVEHRRVQRIQKQCDQPVHWLDFAEWLRDPEAQTLRLATWLGLQASPADVSAVLRGADLQRYSKDHSQRFDNTIRRRELDQSIAQHRAEVEDALAWHRDVLLSI
ncbi:MAG: hypothetical protein J0L65_02680 [Xanthomonadales bacterium]|jgi:hypothetical protein|nr:hypothetical protein [Xanthomonadales bacterium]